MGAAGAVVLRFVAVAPRTIPQRELRNNIGAILREAEAGATFTVTVRGRPVATLGPARAGRRVDVDRETMRGILSTPLDGAAMLGDLDRAEAPVDDPWRD
jgi:prevent-host-death family protein